MAPQLKSPDDFTFGIFNSANVAALPTADSFFGDLINLTLPTTQPKTASVLTNENTGLITIVAAPVPEASTTVSLGPAAGPWRGRHDRQRPAAQGVRVALKGD